MEVYDGHTAECVATLGAGFIKMPNALAFDPDGNLYVADSRRDRVWVFDRSFSLIRIVGASGSASGQFKFPCALTFAPGVDGTTELYVADQGNFRVQVFNLAGVFLRQLGSMATHGMVGVNWQGKFILLQAVAVDSLGRLHALDTNLAQVQIMNDQAVQSG